MNNTVSTVQPAGIYWVGDPCYAFGDHDLWIDLLESADYKNQSTILEAEARGMRFVASSTAYGDGEYCDNNGREFPVDAGLIGVTPARKGEPVPQGMHLVVFREDFTVSFDRENSGTISIGDVSIVTDERAWFCDECGWYEVEDEGDRCWVCESEVEDEDMDE